MSRHDFNFENVPPPPPHLHSDTTAFNRLRSQRQEYQNSNHPQNYGSSQSYNSAAVAGGNYWPQPSYSDTNRNSTASNVTPGADNYSEAAAGGMTGIAMSVADQNARESGIEAMRNTPGYDEQSGRGEGYDPRIAHAGQQAYDPRLDYGNTPRNDYDRGQGNSPNPHDYHHTGLPHEDYSQSSLVPLGAAAMAPAMTSAHQPYSMAHPYSDTPYQRYSEHLDPTGLGFDPNSIEDDGDDGLEYPKAGRASMISLGLHSDNSRSNMSGAAGTAATGGVIGTLGGIVGRGASGSGGAPAYGQVNNPAGGQSYEPKSDWLVKQNSKGNKWKWITGIVLLVLIAGGVGGGVAGYFVNKNKSSSAPSSPTSSNTPSSPAGGSAGDDTAANGDLSINSAEIKALMGNPKLHKVFPGVDYTPMNTQYPGCLTYPPSQNNVTRDLAVLSQLTNVVRLYGTDCNQTEMVIHSINQLNLKGTMKVWLGVWQDKNTTTNARQLAQMYSVLASIPKPSDYFVGAIVGNEVLFRGDQTIDFMGKLLSAVKTNFTTLGYNLPIATADLGDKWTAALAADVDYLMANVHPFFTGKDVSQAADFTWSFWQNNNFVLKPDLSKNYIAETGWPTSGGTDCGDPTVTSCPGTGSVAGISELNTFMGDWVCQALTNGTNYFWFEAFDEPWKIQFDSGVQNWEDQWGVMDVNRNVKPGVTIPSCGGKTVPSL